MPLLEISSLVLVSAEPEQVWDAVVDWSRQEDWVWCTRVHGGTGVGAQVAARTGVGPVGFTDTMVITQWDPPRRCVVRHTGKLVRGLGVFEVARRGGRTEFRWTEQLDLPRPLAGRPGRWLVAPPARWVLALSLRRFARLF